MSRSSRATLILAILWSLAVPPAAAQAVAPPLPAPADESAAAEGSAAGLEPGAHAADSVLLEIRPTQRGAGILTPASAAATTSRIASAVGATATTWVTDSVLSLRVDDPVSAVAALQQRSDVAWASPNYLVQVAALPQDDPLFDLQWPLSNTGQEVSGVVGVPGADVRALEAWDVTTGDPEVVVAIQDTGVSASHPDLAGNMWSNPGGIGGCGAGTHGYSGSIATTPPADDDPCVPASGVHGTHVAGIAAAVGGNGEGISGVAPDVRIMDLALSSIATFATTEAVIATFDFAIQAAEAGVPLAAINASWTCVSCYVPAVGAQVQRLGELGVVIVAASGNQGGRLASDGATQPCGAPFPNVICVGATDNRDQLASFSSNGNDVDLAAPGVEVLSTVIGGPEPYGRISGTSMAAPHVTGATGLLRSACRQLPPDVGVQVMRASAERLDALAGAVTTGGRLDVAAALDEVTACGSRLIAPDLLVAIASPGRLQVDAPLAAVGAPDGTVSVSLSVPDGVTVDVLEDPVELVDGFASVPLEVEVAPGTPLGDLDVVLSLETGGRTADQELRLQVQPPDLAAIRDLVDALEGPEPLLRRGEELTILVDVTNRNGAVGDLVGGSDLPGLDVTPEPTDVSGRARIEDLPVVLSAAPDSAVGRTTTTLSVAEQVAPSEVGTAVVALSDGPLLRVDGDGFAISDGPPSISVSEVEVPVDGVVHAVELHGLDHTYAEDVSAVVGAPFFGFIRLFSGVGGDGQFQDADLVFLDDPSLPLLAGTDSGTYRPSGSFPNAVDSLQGTWSLRVSDDVEEDGGDLDGWTLVVRPFPPISTTTVTATGTGAQVQVAWTQDRVEQGSTVTVRREPASGGDAQVVAAGALTSPVVLPAEPVGSWVYRVEVARYDGSVPDAVPASEVVTITASSSPQDPAGAPPTQPGAAPDQVAPGGAAQPDGTSQAGVAQQPGGSSPAGGPQQPAGTPQQPAGAPQQPAEGGDVAGDDPTGFSVTVSQQRFDDAGGFAQATRRRAAHAVLARDDTFADALTGSVLSGDGPLLLTPAATLDPAVEVELRRVLPDGGTVYLLGGSQALAPAMDAQLREIGLVPVRLAGPSRVETALAIADAAGMSAQVLIARATGPDSAAWADAITAGAYAAATGTPVLLTPSDTVHPAVADWLAGRGAAPVLLGGTTALSDAVAAALDHPRRVAGAERAGTAVAIADDLWRDRASSTRMVINGFAATGWTFGLVGAGLAADERAPMLVVGDTVPPATLDAVSDCGGPALTIRVLGDLVPTAVRDELRAARAEACGTG